LRTLSADWVVPVEGAPIADGAVAIDDDGRIAAVGPRVELGGDVHYPESVILPGFVNAHTHVEYDVYVGFGDGLGFAEWIGLHVQRKQRIDLADMEAIARLGALSCLRSGITTVGDCSFSGAAVQPVKRPDEEINDEIQSLMSNAWMGGESTVTVRVTDGVVDLSGKLSSKKEKEVLAAIAQHTTGVRDVVDRLTLTVGAPRDDNEIRNEIFCCLRQDVWIEDRFVTVSVQEGRVVLQGTVGTALAKTHAGQDAWVRGVSEVNNQLTVDYRITEAMRREQSSELAAAGGDNESYVPRKLQRSDTDIAADVRHEIDSNPFADTYRVKVAVKKGVVILNGIVYTNFDSLQTVATAEAVPGVQKVENKLKIKLIGPPHKNDCRLENEIRHRLERNPRIDGKKFHVAVKGGMAVITGTTELWAEKSAVLNETYKSGAFSVIDKIQYITPLDD
jgi:osmotically-inducible protein OsmY